MGSGSNKGGSGSRLKNSTPAKRRNPVLPFKPASKNTVVPF